MGRFAPTTLGTVIRTRRVGEFRIVDARYAPHARIAPHSHRDDSITLVRAGSFTERSSGSTFTCESGSAIYSPRMLAHQNEFGADGARTLIIEFASAGRNSPTSAIELPPKPAACRGPQLDYLTKQMVLEMASSDAAGELAIEGLLLELLAYVIRTSPGKRRRSRSPGWMRDVVAMLHDHVAAPLRMAEVASVVGVHPVHLARTFRQHFGCTLGTYQRRLRIEFAVQLLTSTDDSIAQVALASGFADHAHFCRCFKRQVGLTPSAFRRARAAR